MLRWFVGGCLAGALSSVGCAAGDRSNAATSVSTPMPTVVEETPAPIPGRCFGDSPPEQIAADPRPRDLFATGTAVIWRSGQSFHRLDLARASTSTVDAGRLLFVHAADSREVLGADGQLNLLSLDLSTGSVRLVSPSGAFSTPRVPGVITLMGASYILDSDYVYVGWPGDPATHAFLASGGEHLRRLPGSHDAGFLSRIKRDGSSAAEHLGKGPDGRFIISGGYAYWGSRWEGLKRRPLVPGQTPSEVVWAAPDVALAWPIAISGGRLYFRMTANTAPPFSFSIASVPATAAPGDGGSAPPRVYVSAAPQPFNDAILDGKCVYSGGPGGVVRANLDDGTVQKLIEGRPVPGDATVIGSQFLATDGQALYWADNGGDRVVRWRR